MHETRVKWVDWVWICSSKRVLPFCLHDFASSISAEQREHRARMGTGRNLPFLRNSRTPCFVHLLCVSRMFVQSCSQYGSPSFLSTVFILFSVYRLIMRVKNYLHTDYVGRGWWD